MSQVIVPTAPAEVMKFNKTGSSDLTNLPYRHICLRPLHPLFELVRIKSAIEDRLRCLSVGLCK